MPKALDLIGSRFGRLVVIERAEDHVCNGSGEHKRRWKCKCDCGNTTYCTTGDLRRGDIRSCGCYCIESRSKNATTHGLTKTRLHSIWMAMRKRCSNINSKDYKWYGGKGIVVCDEWNNGFKKFYDWAIANGYKEGLTIDRINPDGNYSPENCRWVTMKEQQNNRTSNRIITFAGHTHNIREWSDLLGIPYSTLYMRIYKGWSLERALS